MLTPQQRKDIVSLAPQLREIKQVLFSVKNYGEMPRGKGHLYSRYKNQGLIYLGKRTTKTGKKTFGKVRLTPKGKRMLPLLGL